MLRETVYGNPHSVNPTSSASTVLVERARAAVLRYFNARRERVRLHLHPERHRRAAARRRGVSVRARRTSSWRRSTTTTPSTGSASSPARRARGPRTCRSRRPTCAWPTDCSSATSTSVDADGRNLFAYPAQSNFSGVKHPLEWIALAQARGWDVILDAAAFVPTSRLDLSVWKPDFVPISFYKMFGYPTGLGALLGPAPRAREAAATLVQRRHRGRRERPGRDGRAAVRPRAVRGRDGQLPRHPGDRDRPAPPRPDRHRHRSRAASTRSGRGCSRRCRACGIRTAARRRSSTGRRRGTAAAARSRSTSCTPTAAVVDERFVDIVAAAHNISVRTGCFCNSGAGETAFSISKDTLIGAEFADGMILDDYLALVGMPTGGAVRVSLGLATNFADVYRFMQLRDRVPRRDRGPRRTCRPGSPARR